MNLNSTKLVRTASFVPIGWSALVWTIKFVLVLTGVKYILIFLTIIGATYQKSLTRFAEVYCLYPI